MRHAVLVLGDYMQSITVVRSLVRAGLVVVVGRTDRTPPSALSRGTAGTWTHPDPEESDAFGSALVAFLAERPDISHVFPIGETEISALLITGARLNGRVRCVMPSADTVTACLDKPTANRIAAEIGVPTPTATVASNHSELISHARALGAPFVVKTPNSSRSLGDHKAILCAGADELDAWRETIDDTGWPLLVQRYAEGHRHNCHFAAVNGRVVAYFEDRMLRSDRPDGTGYAVDGISVAPSAALRAHCDALVARLGYHGVGCAQFLVDFKTGDAAFLELNPRLDAICELPYHCGIDFPLLALQCADGVVPDAVNTPSYPVGKRFHWLLGDLRGIVGGARRGRLQGTHIFRAAGDLAKSHWHADARLTWSWSDPLPSCFLYGRELTSVRPRLGGPATNQASIQPSRRRMTRLP